MMRIFSSLMILGLMNFSLSAFSADKIKAGTWRFEMQTTYATIPFVIDFKWKKGELTGKLLNGKETIELRGIQVKKDEISIPLQTYQNSLELVVESNEIVSGHHVRNNKNPILKTPLRGHFGESKRFPKEHAPSKINIDGKWSLSMTDEEGVVSPGIAVFHQKGDVIHGTILTSTGDYRYFEGYATSEEFEVASFDGVFNYLFNGKVTKDTFKGSIGNNGMTKVEGKRDSKATLPDAYAQTQVTSFNFLFPDLQTGKLVALSDAKFKNKPIIVQFFGSWCPNCMDETNFLIPWYKANRKRGVEIVALAFERALDPEGAKIQLKKVKQKKNIPYTILIAGTTAEDKPKDKIQGLTNFISFPTTVFLNRKHEVVKVHAGFSGPSTGEYFEKWKSEFDQTVNGLLK